VARARVFVTLKDSVNDPIGNSVTSGIAALGIEGVLSVRQGKVFDIVLAPGINTLQTLEDACKKLLANHVIEDYTIEV
jgi:phosphoribosylformylglycinamidine synthase subunit PurS